MLFQIQIHMKLLCVAYMCKYQYEKCIIISIPKSLIHVPLIHAQHNTSPGILVLLAITINQQ